MSEAPLSDGPRILRGRIPKEHEKEHLERWSYESGEADRAAAATPGPHSEPWLNVLAMHEPGSRPALDCILGEPWMAQRVKGAVLDAAAGTCWLSAAVSRLERVSEVFALDLSERFLTTTGLRILQAQGAAMAKVCFVASDFTEIPLDSGSVDCAFLFAALHHSLAPIKTLQEIGRCLKPGGTLFIHEQPSSLWRIRRRRREALALSTQTTEIAYTRDELEYLFANAKIGPVRAFTVPTLSKNPAKSLARRALRRLGLERHLPTPPAYIFAIVKQ